MARTRLIARAKYNHRRANYQRLRVRLEIKNIEGRIWNRDIKIKQIIPQSQNIEVKKMDKLLEEWLLEEKQYFREIGLLNIETM